MTFHAVASFASASSKRLHAFQILAASTVAGAILWTLHLGWVPAIEEAISRLPGQGAVRDGLLQWDGDPLLLLTEGVFVGVLINVSDAPKPTQIADVRFEVRRAGLNIHSLLGYADVPYWKGWRMALNRTELEPWWGAWKPFVLGGIASGIVVGLLLVWNITPLLYILPVRLLAFYLDRQVSWAGCWKLGAASFLPGSAVLAGAVVLYALQQLPVLGLLIAIPLHLVLGWFYLAFCPASLPKLPSVVQHSQNPFAQSAAAHSAKSTLQMPSH